MTELGRMLIEDGRTEGRIEGRTEGRTEGKIETLIKLLIKKFGFLSEEYKSKISKLSNETIDIYNSAFLITKFYSQVKSGVLS